MSARPIFVAILACLSLSAASRDLTGKVVDATSGEGISRARITIHFFQNGPQTPEATIMSDSDGSFRVTNLPMGSYSLTCEKPGYLAADPGGMRSPDDRTSANLELKMIGQAVLEGTVVDLNDVPSRNTFVQLLSSGVVEGRRTYLMANGSGTDETGSFRIHGLRAGRYYVAVNGRLNGLQRAKPLAYPQFLYPLALDLATAEAIDLKAGDDRQIKIRLPEPVPAYEISGAVVTGEGTPASFQLTRLGGGPFLGSIGETTYNPLLGTFKISHVTPGTYSLGVQVRDGGRLLMASKTVTVAGENVGGIRLDPIAIVLDGRVRVEGDSGQPRVVNYVNLLGAQFSGGAPVAPDGQFHIMNLAPDSYRVAPNLNPQWCIRSILQGGRDVRDRMTISEGMAPAPIEITATNHCGSIEATITPPDGGMPPNVMAMLLRKVGDEWVLANQTFVRGGTSDAPPRVTLQGVTPGDYLLFAWPESAPIEYANADYMRQFESYGQPVTVAEDGKATVTVDKILMPPK